MGNAEERGQRKVRCGEREGFEKGKKEEREERKNETKYWESEIERTERRKAERNKMKKQLFLSVPVRYHCGGWPKEVNTCFLNSYMVYL